MLAALRLLLLVALLAGFLVVFAPLQWVIAARFPRFAHLIPRFFCATLLSVMRVEVTTVGTRVSGRPAIMAPNHVSWIDILVLGGLFPFCFLAKSEVAKWPILSAFADVQGTVYVDRKRRRSIPAANRAMAARLAAGRSVLLFPEGTTVAPPEPARFGPSHFAAARDFIATGRGDTVCVQPVAVAYSEDRAAWIGDDDLLSHLWRTLRLPPLRCVVSFGAPIVCEAGFDRKRVAHQVRDSVITMLAANRIAGAARTVPPSATMSASAFPSPVAVNSSVAPSAIPAAAGTTADGA